MNFIQTPLGDDLSSLPILFSFVHGHVEIEKNTIYFLASSVTISGQVSWFWPMRQKQKSVDGSQSAFAFFL